MVQMCTLCLCGSSCGGQLGDKLGFERRGDVRVMTGGRGFQADSKWIPGMVPGEFQEWKLGSLFKGRVTHVSVLVGAPTSLYKLTNKPTS